MFLTKCHRRNPKIQTAIQPSPKLYVRLNFTACHGFLQKARELNPDMVFIEELSTLYRRTAQMWGGDNTKNDPDNLEALGGGFNVTLEALQDKERCVKIATKIREFADVADKILRLLNKNINVE